MPHQDPKPECHCTATHEGTCQDSRVEEKCPGEHCVYSSLEICPFDGSTHTPRAEKPAWEQRFDEKFPNAYYIGAEVCGGDFERHSTFSKEYFKDFINYAIQEAVEEERRRIAEEILKRMDEAQSELVDRDTNFGMNESYRMALDRVRMIIKAL